MQFHRFLLKHFAILTLLCASLIWLRFGLSLKLYHWYLNWNLFLAWVPYLTSYLMYVLDKRKQLGFVPALLLTGVWLVFFPNAGYLVTDFIHLQRIPPVPYWFDVIMFSLFAFTGIALAIASVDQIFEVLKKHFSPSLTAAIMAGLSLISGFGLYLGRVERWNSWQVLTHPLVIVTDSIRILTSPSMYPLLIAFCLFSISITAASGLLFETLKKNRLA
jgi:uncharacterized membrane protein